MRNLDVRHLLDHVDNSLGYIKVAYDRALRDKRIAPPLRIDVKNAMENMRSALDYMAQDIADEIVAPHLANNNLKAVKLVYFPYGRDQQTFEAFVRRFLPDLHRLNSQVYEIIESIQPHSCGNGWLYDFCNIVNENKHDALSAQERTERQSYTVRRTGGGPAISAPAGAIRAPPGAISLGGAPVVFDSTTGIPLQTPGLDVQVTTWVSFKFGDTEVAVYPLLETAAKGIRQTAQQLYKELP